MLFDYFENISFSQPYFLWLLLLIPIMIWWNSFYGKRRQAAFKVSATHSVSGLQTFRNMMVNLPFIFRLLAIASLVFALARPQVKFQEQQTEGEGIDIILCIDVSGSMTAQDFKPNRMEAAKNVAMDFVSHRPTDRIGIVIFAGESFTQCPLTTDQYVLRSQIQQIRNGLLEDGTAIGSGLATSVDRLRNSKSKSKIIILLTDGVNNGGLIDPSTAKEIAKTFKIKVYTIGVGTDGYAPTPQNTDLGVVIQNEKVSIDEKLLKNIADETGGQYFRATDNKSLTNIYKEIDKLEKSKVEITKFSRFTEKYYPLIFAALFFIFIELLLKYALVKKFP